LLRARQPLAQKHAACLRHTSTNTRAVCEQRRRRRRRIAPALASTASSVGAAAATGEHKDASTREQRYSQPCFHTSYTSTRTRRLPHTRRHHVSPPPCIARACPRQRHGGMYGGAWPRCALLCIVASCIATPSPHAPHTRVQPSAASPAACRAQDSGKLQVREGGVSRVGVVSDAAQGEAGARRGWERQTVGDRGLELPESFGPKPLSPGESDEPGGRLGGGRRRPGRWV